ncbi:terpene synthase [Neoconidiobolus thromboides FSU 785]|nr:terpene synthase [Neoconidiobolus thromboides FSU 785]
MTLSIGLDEIPATDLNGWRMKVDDGRQTWHYLNTKEERQNWPQTKFDKYSIGLEYEKASNPKADKASEAAYFGYNFLKDLQTEDGHFACEYGGPLFLIPGLAVTYYITQFELGLEYRKELIRYLLNFQNKDGGWGLHIEHHSTMYGTVMNYVSLRIFGLDKEHVKLKNARKFIIENGGAVSVPSWGKLLLACMNLYDYQGMNPIPPELWILPDWSPFHPGKMWVHSRNVYTPMSYLYGVKFQCEENSFIEELRREIYNIQYDNIDWSIHRNNIHSLDLYQPHSTVMKAINYCLTWYEQASNYIGQLRELGIKEALNQIEMEDENTKYLDVGPVNQVLNMLCIYHKYGVDNERFLKHVERIGDFLHLGRDGMMMNGTNGVQLWDTAFIVQAMVEAKLQEKEEFKDSLIKAYEFIDQCQIKSNSIHYGKDYRHISKGAWPFSTRDQSYTVSDCTAEGLKAVLYLQNLNIHEKLISDERLFDAVNVLLSIQNPNGGCASYELVRGGAYFELLNVAEVFSDIMIEYSYPECTTAVLLGLTAFQKFYPDHRSNEIKVAQKKAVDYIKSIQWKDGSWYGSWGVCFTYATFFAIESLSTFGEFYNNSKSVKNACDYLVSKQMNDGGWGETYKSCENKKYTQAEKSQVVNTSWAILSLMAAKYPDEEIIRKGIKLIMDRQLPSGEWEQELIEGVFNKNCMISYPNYKLTFTIWALGRYAKLYDDKPF